MDNIINKYKVDKLRKEFKEYLVEINPSWSDNTVSMHYSDAFFALNNDVGIEFWSSFICEDAMEQARDKIQSFLERQSNTAQRAKERAAGYLISMKYLKAFLDEKYNDIPKEWSGKQVINKYLKSDFISWMQNRMKSNNEPYKPNTINAYVIALKNSSEKLNISNIEPTDLFFYTTVEDFEKVYKIIKEDPNFEEIDKAAGNKAYSNGLILYRKFLNELRNSVDINDLEPVPKDTTDKIVEDRHYWLYAPGNNSYKWDEFYEQGIMGIGWDEMGDLSQYTSKDSMKTKMKELYGPEYSYRNSAHATWQFANELHPGDIVYAKKGMYKIVGRGIVESGYIYEEECEDYKHIHKIKWTHYGEWEHPGQAALKTLTDITQYLEYVQKLERLFINDEYNTEEEKEITYANYTEDDFLKDVFMDYNTYATLANLLKTKKNIILQGAPGVGKTFAAKRLAYSIMRTRDTSRVMMIQFHQSYSYEDFIMGFRPTKDGFELKSGPFYQFCKEAQDDERDYFFIIDEINRGNLSKIFGELLMLIENDKRGEELRILYSNELFSVPKNMHIIGMMNTADRSLAMIDYALRRRFAFFEIAPAFDSEGFSQVISKANNAKFSSLINEIKALNDFISKDESLGDGFRIGHSYFCTNEEVTDACLTSVVKYEILPLLNEYWFDEKSKIEQWSNRLYGVLND